MTPKQIKEIIKLIPSECNPRLGGSASLYFRGLVDSFRDIDIIVDKGTLNKIDLNYPRIQLMHEGINKRNVYCINGREVDILESLCPISRKEMSLLGVYFENVENVLYAKKLINEYLNTTTK